MLQKYQDDLADLPDNNGDLQATLYSILTVGLVVSGATYLLQPQVWAATIFECSPTVPVLHHCEPLWSTRLLLFQLFAWKMFPTIDASQLDTR